MQTAVRTHDPENITKSYQDMLHYIKPFHYFHYHIPAYQGKCSSHNNFRKIETNVYLGLMCNQRKLSGIT